MEYFWNDTMDIKEVESKPTPSSIAIMIYDKYGHNIKDTREYLQDIADKELALKAFSVYLEMVERQIEIDNKQDKPIELNGEPLADRFNDGKLEWTLLDYGTLEGLVKVLTFGKIKYGRDNWKKGLKYLSIADSMLRHLFAFLRGEDLDPESGLPHTDHILCNAKFLAYMFNNRKDLDDREINEINR